MAGADKRRALLGALVIAPLAGCGPVPATGFADIPSALAMLDRLRTQPQRTRAGWPLPRMLEHAAQSVEYSMTGYPALKPAWFRATLGSTAFRVFDARGAMTHALDEPIPGAPALGLDDLEAAAIRLKGALARFAAHRGALQPHFAYGELDHAQYTRAHLMHLANHWTEVVPA